MFTQPDVIAAMKEFVLVELYTDDPNEGVAEKNQKLQDERYRTVAVPYYVIIDTDERVRGAYPTATRDKNEWLKFLTSARASS